MPRDGSYRLNELPAGYQVQIACRKCQRAGRYRAETLVKMFGGDMALPDLLSQIPKDCPRLLAGHASDRCGAFFENRWPWA